MIGACDAVAQTDRAHRWIAPPGPSVVTSPPASVGVVGAGAMGAGIAQLACAAGMETRLFDVSADAVEHAVARIALVLARVVCQLVNEACFALGASVASAGDVDLAMRLGVGHPFGPLEWAERIGWSRELSAAMVRPDRSAFSA